MSDFPTGFSVPSQAVPRLVKLSGLTALRRVSGESQVKEEIGPELGRTGDRANRRTLATPQPHQRPNCPIAERV